MRRSFVLIPGRNNNVSIAVLGPGAVGGFLAALFLKNGFPVTCIAKEEAVELISHEGIHLESVSFGNFTVYPMATTQINFKPDILFITTKATGLNDMLRRVNPDYVRNSIIIPLLNGIEHLDLLRSLYGKTVIAASIGNVEIKRISTTYIVHLTPLVCIELACEKGILKSKIAEVAQLLSKLGIKVKLLNSEAEVLWRKLVRLNAIACTTAAINKPIGFIRQDKYWREQLEGCVREAVTVAFAEGVQIDPSEVMKQIDSLPTDMGTSMQRDIVAGKLSELDAIAGAIVRVGKKYGLCCPIIQNIIGLIQSKIDKSR